MTDNIGVDLLTLARKVNNYIVDATVNGTGNDKFDSDVLQEYQVPINKRWFVKGGQVTRDVSSTCIITARDTADKIIHMIMSAGAAAGTISYPNTVAATSTFPFGEPITLDAGEYIMIGFGTAQTTGASASCVVLEIDV